MVWTQCINSNKYNPVTEYRSKSDFLQFLCVHETGVTPSQGRRSRIAYANRAIRRRGDNLAPNRRSNPARPWIRMTQRICRSFNLAPSDSLQQLLAASLAVFLLRLSPPLLDRGWEQNINRTGISETANSARAAPTAPEPRGTRLPQRRIAFGSRASCRPSPRKLNAITVMKMSRPGQTASSGAS